jgi:HTH-type transcriptional regulator/antitoxin HipB
MLVRSPRDLGLTIRDRRKQLGLDQAELAQRAGVSRQWVVEIESGKARAALGLVLRTLRALDLVLDARVHDAGAGEAAPAARQRKPATKSKAKRGVPVDLDALIDRARGDRK